MKPSMAIKCVDNKYRHVYCKGPHFGPPIENIPMSGAIQKYENRQEAFKDGWSLIQTKDGEFWYCSECSLLLKEMIHA